VEMRSEIFNIDDADELHSIRVRSRRRRQELPSCSTSAAFDWRTLIARLELTLPGEFDRIPLYARQRTDVIIASPLFFHY
jgi:hypothetical protein